MRASFFQLNRKKFLQQHGGSEHPCRRYRRPELRSAIAAIGPGAQGRLEALEGRPWSVSDQSDQSDWADRFHAGPEPNQPKTENINTKKQRKTKHEHKTNR